MDKTIEWVRRELKGQADEKMYIGGQRFFKNAVKLYGTRSPEVRKISQQSFAQIKGAGSDEIYALCEALWRSGYLEETFVACNWSYRLHKKYRPKDFKLFEKWIAKYVNNWASCDIFCSHTVGCFVEMYPRYITDIKKWAKSKNRWVKRAAAVTFIIPARHGKFLDDIFEIAAILLRDTDDMVQKGYGWMLKAASEAHQKQVFDFVLKHKTDMPRTALRYAIEKMPPALRAKAMEK